MYYIDAELLQVTCTNLAWKCRVCVRVDFSVFYAYACQALPLWSELTNNTAKTKVGYISLPPLLNAI